MEIDKTIEALKICGGDTGCVKCPYQGERCTEKMMRDAVTCLEVAQKLIERAAVRPFKHRYPPKHYEHPGRPASAVLMMDMAGNLLMRFASAKEAGEHVGKDPSNIRKACVGTLYSAAGFRWAYEEV